MDIYLIRHGQTDYNVAHRLQGQRDTDLNDRGRAQAREGAAFLRGRGIHIAHVYSSPLKRAVETAEIMTGIPRDRFTLDDRLKEIDFGPVEGEVWEELGDVFSDYIDDPWANPPFDGIEPVPHLLERTKAFLQALYASPEPGPVLIATHGMTLHALLVNMDSRDRWIEPTGNCTVYHCETREDGVTPPVQLTATGPTFG